MTVTVEPLAPDDAAWAVEALAAVGGEPIVTPSGVYHCAELGGLKALISGRSAGLLHYLSRGGELEIVTLVSLCEGRGVGSSLIRAAESEAARLACRRIWVTTTNDNLPALRFYQRRGFRMRKLHVDWMERVRTVKPHVPRAGRDGIPLMDLIELELARQPVP